MGSRRKGRRFPSDDQAKAMAQQALSSAPTSSAVGEALAMSAGQSRLEVESRWCPECGGNVRIGSERNSPILFFRCTRFRSGMSHCAGRVGVAMDSEPNSQPLRVDYRPILFWASERSRSMKQEGLPVALGPAALLQVFTSFLATPISGVPTSCSMLSN